MFAPHCPRHGNRVLLGFEDYAVHNTAAGVEVHWRCTCGHRGVTFIDPSIDASPSSAGSSIDGARCA